MEEGDEYDSQSQAASRSTEQDGTEQTPSGCHSFLQSQFNGTDNTVFVEAEQGFQPVSDRLFAGHNSYQANGQPAIKKFRRPELDETNDGEKEKEETLFSDDNAVWLIQCVPTRPQSPDCACVDPQFQAASLGLPVAHEQSFWSQDFALPAECVTISGVARGRRRHAICEELDTTGRLQRNRSEESFNLGNISDELDILTNTSRKRKR